MKNLLLTPFFSLLILLSHGQQAVSINTTGAVANSSAILDVSSTNKGMLIPRMDSTQRKNILNKAVGLMVFDTQTSSFWYYQNTGWTELQTVAGNSWQKNGTGIYNSNTGNVGIGLSAPVTKLHVKESAAANVATFDGGQNMWVTLAEGGINRGYIGSYAGNPDDVDFGTYGGTTGKVHLTTANIPRLTVTNSGNVGVNNTNPIYNFDVLGSSNTSSLYISTGGNTNDFLIKENGSGKVGFRKSFSGLGLNYCICLYGVFPPRERPAAESESTSTPTSVLSTEPYIGEIMLFAGNFPPRNWAFCNGQILPIASNTALFSLLGTMYGGNGITTFALPDLRDAVPVHFGTNWTQGETNK